MPNRYEREIEEILRNMDQTDHGQGLGERIRAFNRPTPRTRVARPRLQLRLTRSESFLVSGVALALAGAGVRFYFGYAIELAERQSTTNMYAIIAGVLGVAGLACLLTGLVIGWSQRFSGGVPTTWRGQRIEVTRVPRPFRGIATQFRILRLKWRYWRSRGR